MKKHGFIERRDEELIRKASGPEASEQTKKRNRILKWIGIAACVCLLAGGVVWAVLFGFNRKDDPTQVAQNSAEATEAGTKATQEPTEAPTQAPTEAPTQAPTEAPTQAPTQEPTEAPTQ